jgi:hypothetical protein
MTSPAEQKGYTSFLKKLAELNSEDDVKCYISFYTVEAAIASKLGRVFTGTYPGATGDETAISYIEIELPGHVCCATSSCEKYSKLPGFRSIYIV